LQMLKTLFEKMSQCANTGQKLVLLLESQIEPDDTELPLPIPIKPEKAPPHLKYGTAG
jgi:hypothetical protein